MNSLIRLRTEDFEVVSGTKGAILKNNISGISLCMFYSPACKICDVLLPQFRQLPQIFNNCKFCILNINENQNVIVLSRQTISPISFVPHIVLYVNSKPLIQYDDEANISKLVNFVKYSINLVEKNQKFFSPNSNIESEIPKYCIAKPYLNFKCEEWGTCYLTYKEAYINKEEKNQTAN